MRKDIKFSIQHLWAVTVIAGIFIFVSTHPIRPHDFWWHMAIGREILSTGHIPLLDTYSYTMTGEPYPSYQIYWLMEVAMYFIYSLGRGELLVFIHSILITGAYGIILWLCLQASKSWRVAAFGTLFAAALGLNDWNVRPQAISFIIGATILLAIYQLKVKRKKIWLGFIILAMIVWVNSHGTFPIGLVLIGVWWLEEAWLTFRQKGGWKDRILWPTVAGMVGGLACLVNPQGLGIVKYVSRLTGNPIIQNLVPEWSAPTFSTLGGSIFLISLLLFACVLMLSPRRPSFSQVVLFIIFSFLGLKTMRGVIWFGIVMAPVFADHLAAFTNSLISEKHESRNYHGSLWINRIFLLTIFIMLVCALPWFKKFLPLPNLKAGIYSYETPIQATDYLLNQKLPGPLFHAMSFGSYLIWSAHPDYRVFVDPRIELYDSKLWSQYLVVTNGGHGWEEVLDEYGIQTIMAAPGEQSRLIAGLKNSQSWRRVYMDQAAVIFTRQ